MIVLDTNVLSALMQVRPDSGVVDWLDAQPAESVWIASVTLFEARFGLALLLQGRRRQAMERRFTQLLEEDLENRVLLFDQEAAVEASRLAARRRLAGRPVDMRDTFIAGIVVARRAILATRNIRHFDDLPIRVVNPFNDS